MTNDQQKKSIDQLALIPILEEKIDTKLERVLENTDNWRHYYTDIDGAILALSLVGLHLDELPEEIGMLTELNYLDVSQNNLKAIPEFIKNLKHLAILKISNNQLYTLPEWIGDLNLLKHLHLDNNQLYSVEIKGRISGLHNLYYITK